MRETQFVFLIPAYNCEKEIKQTLMSIFAQSYYDWRIILVDDVSTDNTTKIAKESSEKFIPSSIGTDPRINLGQKSSS